jgi:hypothetical protein
MRDDRVCRRNTQRTKGRAEKQTNIYNRACVCVCVCVCVRAMVDRRDSWENNIMANRAARVKKGCVRVVFGILCLLLIVYYKRRRRRVLCAEKKPITRFAPADGLLILFAQMRR